MPETVRRTEESTVRGVGHHVVADSVEAAATIAGTTEVEAAADSED